MALPEQVRNQIDSLVKSSDVVLFMKGNRQGPQCGFSATVVQILDTVVPEYKTVDVLADPQIRDGIKEYSNWPTIPQLYIHGEFVGGCDIVREMFAAGELHEKLGLPAPERKIPTIKITDTAATALKDYAAKSPGMNLRLSVDARFQPSLGFAPKQAGDIEVQANGVGVVLDFGSAQRADGITIDAAQTERGLSFRIDNPNAPAR